MKAVYVIVALMMGATYLGLSAWLMPLAMLLTCELLMAAGEPDHPKLKGKWARCTLLEKVSAAAGAIVGLCAVLYIIWLGAQGGVA